VPRTATSESTRRSSPPSWCGSRRRRARNRNVVRPVL
jgi:hypothetical protein